MARCYNKESPAYSRYGGRGLWVCERWQDPAKFIQDMGQPGLGETIDRVDNTRGYSPENCRWATRKTQTRNRAITLMVEYAGETLPLGELFDRHGVHYRSGWHRWKRLGWSLERVLETGRPKKRAGA